MNSLLAIVTFCLALAALANAQNCILTVPANPLSAVGLATPYTQVGCLMAEGTPSFAQATILDVSRGTFFGYNPLVIDNGTLPASPPTIPILPVNNIVGIWFGTNGRTLVLQDNGQGSLGQGSCVNGITGSNFGKFAHCNAIIFFQVAKQLIDLGRVTVPALGLTLNGQPCPTIRDFTFVDKTPSDGVNTVYLLDPIAKTVAQDTSINRNIIPNSLNLTNNQDNFLLRTLSEAIGCRQWLIQDLADPTQVIATLGTNELQAIFRTSGPLALIPCNHPFAVLDLTGQISLSKVNALRSAVGQNLAFSVNDCSATEFCANFVNVAPARIMLDKNLTFIVDSIDLTVADNLFHFLAGRFTDSFGPAGLNCTGLLNFPNPISLDFDGIRVVDAFISVLRPAPTTLPPILASPVPGSPTPPAAPTVAPTSAPSWDVLNTLGLVTASVNVVNGVMTCRLAAGVNGYIAVAWGGGHGSNSPGVICTVIGSTPICRDINIRGRTGLQTSSAQLVTAVSGSLANGRMLVTFTRPISGITDNINVISNAFFAVSNTPFASTDTTINIFHNAGQGGPLNFAFSSSATGSVPTPPPALVFDDQVSSTLELVSASINLNKAKNEAQFTIKAVCTGYIAIAFGAHDSGSAAIICWLDGNSIAKCSDATIGSRSSTSLAATNQITSVTGALTGGTLSFTFVRSLTGLVTNVNTPAQVFWAISNTIPTITNNAISTYHGPLRGGQNLLFFTSESLTTPITDPVTQAPTITPGGAISVFGPVTTSVTVSGGQMSLSMAVSLTKRQTFGYIALAFGKSHGSPPADGIACWMNTQVVCYEITVGSKSAAGVITGAQITTTSGGSNGGQMIFSFSHSLRFGSTNLDGSQVTTYWSFGANAPVNKQLAIHSQQASTGATMLLSQSTGGSPTTAPIASTSNTILGLSSGVFALMVVVLIVVVVAIIGFFIWKKKQSSNTRGSLPIPSNPLYHPDMQNSPRAY